MLEQAGRALEAPARCRTVIAAQCAEATDGAVIARESPAHGRIVSLHPKSTGADALAAFAAARGSFDAGDLASARGGARSGRLREVARRIRAGRVWVNAALRGFSELPPGGFGPSRNGRESVRHGGEEYTALQSVRLRVGQQPETWVEGA